MIGHPQGGPEVNTNLILHRRANLRIIIASMKNAKLFKDRSRRKVFRTQGYLADKCTDFKGDEENVKGVER